MSPYRSKTSTAGRNMAGARSLWGATGMNEENFQKPIIAVVNSFTMFVPANVHLKDLGQFVAREIEPGRANWQQRARWLCGEDGGVDESILVFEGSAHVTESQDEAVEKLNDKVKAGDVVIVRKERPKGSRGMQEMLYPTSYITTLR